MTMTIFKLTFLGCKTLWSFYVFVVRFTYIYFHDFYFIDNIFKKLINEINYLLAVIGYNNNIEGGDSIVYKYGGIK